MVGSYNHWCPRLRSRSHLEVRQQKVKKKEKRKNGKTETKGRVQKIKQWKKDTFLVEIRRGQGNRKKEKKKQQNAKTTLRSKIEECTRRRIKLKKKLKKHT